MYTEGVEKWYPVKQDCTHWNQSSYPEGKTQSERLEQCVKLGSLTTLVVLMISRICLLMQQSRCLFTLSEVRNCFLNMPITKRSMNRTRLRDTSSMNDNYLSACAPSAMKYLSDNSSSIDRPHDESSNICWRFSKRGEDQRNREENRVEDKSRFNEWRSLRHLIHVREQTRREKSNEHVISFDRWHLVSVERGVKAFDTDQLAIFVMALLEIRLSSHTQSFSSVNVYVFVFLLGNASLISEALRHYQRLERQHVDEGALVEISQKKLDKHHRRHNPQDNRPLLIEPTVRREKVSWIVTTWKNISASSEKRMIEGFSKINRRLIRKQGTRITASQFFNHLTK